jgi:hypothetical protein
MSVLNEKRCNLFRIKLHYNFYKINNFCNNSAKKIGFCFPTTIHILFIRKILKILEIRGKFTWGEARFSKNDKVIFTQEVKNSLSFLSIPPLPPHAFAAPQLPRWGKITDELLLLQ